MGADPALVEAGVPGVPGVLYDPIELGAGRDERMTTEDVAPGLAGLEGHLFAARQEFLGFVRRRVSDPELAEDILQDALLHAVQSAGTLEDESRLVPWFYRILRNAIIDTYRRREVRQRRTTRLEDEFDLPDEPSDSDERILCECFRDLIRTLKPEYAEVLDAVDLRQESTEQVTARLGITANNLKVRRHRARQALRERLEETCRVCSTHGCLDCTCEA